MPLENYGREQYNLVTPKSVSYSYFKSLVASTQEPTVIGKLKHLPNSALHS